jgi:glycosyltransferase involved in cell wall biosynthesis
VLLSALHHANIIAVLAAKVGRTGTRVFVSTHNTLSHDTARIATYVRIPELLLLRLCHRAADGVVTVSRGAADDLTSTIKLSRDRIRVIYNPVVTPEMLRAAEEPVSHAWFAPGEPPVVLGVGRLTAQKDFPTLIRAFAIVRRETRARLMILGDGEDHARLALIARELGVEADVGLPGHVPNPHAYIARAAVLVLSSAWEGLPTVLIEALALDTPVISTDCKSGPREILQNGRLGPLVPVADPVAMARAILEVLDAPRRAAPRDAVRPFELATAVSEYLQVLGVGTP